MKREWKKSAIVKPGGVVQVILSDLPAGARVDVVVRSNGSSPRKPRTPRAGFGLDKDLIRMREDFDAPLPDFEDYT